MAPPKATQNKTLHLLCAGAAQGLVKALQANFERDSGALLHARFGAVGAMKEARLAAEPCDLMVLTEAMVTAMAGEGLLLADTAAALGRVRTGVAVRAGQPQPDVSTPEALKAALLAADAVYFPDPVRATAGIHFAKVLQALGIHDTLQPRFRTFPNGATAMRELAQTTAPRMIGCTQVTEINNTEGVDLVAALPARFELVTVYTAAISTSAVQPALAAQFMAQLCGPASRVLRDHGGFEC